MVNLMAMLLGYLIEVKKFKKLIQQNYCEGANLMAILKVTFMSRPQKQNT